MRLWMLAGMFAVIAVLVASPADAQRLNDAAVQAAIDIGSDEDDDDYKDLFEDCNANPGFRERLGASISSGLTGNRVQHTGGYRVTFTNHHGLIAMAAKEAQEKYMPPPAPADIGDDLREPVLRLWIEPLADRNRGDGIIDLAASINHVVIRPEDREREVVQPLSFEAEPVEFTNLFGAQFTSSRALATFPAEAALAAAEDRDLEVVVITPAGERRCNVDNDNIKRMFALDR